MFVASLLALETGYSQRKFVKHFYLANIRRLQSFTAPLVQDRPTKRDRSIQAYERKLYDLSAETRHHLDGLSIYKVEIRSQVDSIGMRMDRAERDIEYMENRSPSQSYIETDDRILEQQVKDAQQEIVRTFALLDCGAVPTSAKSLKVVKRAGDMQGAWLRDPGKGSAYFFGGTRNSTVVEFASLQAFTETNRSETPGAVHIRNRTVSDTVLLRGAGRLPAFSLAPQTFIRLAVDELGVWAVRADPDFGGNLAVAKLDRTNLAAEHTWDTPCKGYSGRSSVRCLFDIQDTIRSGETPPLFFPKRYTSHPSMHYHPKDKEIYAWDDGYQTIYKVELEVGIKL
uniref:Olfactomedin like 1 n=1 Tax=Scleropages formosus TaxID=113540 RepID=A0A8C9SCD0_SCLFO